MHSVGESIGILHAYIVLSIDVLYHMTLALALAVMLVCEKISLPFVWKIQFQVLFMLPTI